MSYRGPDACAAAGITYRQLDYWARIKLVQPSIRAAAGSGTPRLYSARDIRVLARIKALLDAGLSLNAAGETAWALEGVTGLGWPGHAPSVPLTEHVRMSVTA
jgi:hypothetical protein